MPASVEGYSSATILNFVSAAWCFARAVSKLRPAGAGDPGAAEGPMRASSMTSASASSPCKVTNPYGQDDDDRDGDRGDLASALVHNLACGCGRLDQFVPFQIMPF